MNALTSDSDLTYSIPTPPACAACRFQRRKCTPDCTLAPFFPADKQQQFLNVHRLFGVSNILKLLKSIDPNLHQHAMNSIIFQSNIRAQDPAGGCYRIIVDLQRRIEATQAELQYVHRQIACFRAQFDASSDLQTNLQRQQYYNDHYLTQKQILSVQQKAEHDDEELDEERQINVDNMSEMRGHEFGISEDYEDEEKEVNVGFTAMALSSSDIEVETKTREQVQENDLKRAASLFTLTNYDSSDV